MPLPSFLRRKPPIKGLPPGQRIYAVGDIHGRLDLLHKLLERLKKDMASRPAKHTKFIILGDFIDRGPQSRELISLFSDLNDPDLIILKGNHEAALVDAIKGDYDATEMWMRFGGAATLASFGADIASIDPDDTAALIALIRSVIPTNIATWLEKLPLSHAAGGYFFTHAGIRPGIPLTRQAEADLLWIREAFTSSDADHGAIIVHGHSIYEDGVNIATNRIGVDTGAYRTGLLSAVGLEGDQIWVIESRP